MGIQDLLTVPVQYLPAIMNKNNLTYTLCQYMINIPVCCTHTFIFIYTLRKSDTKFVTWMIR